MKNLIRFVAVLLACLCATTALAQNAGTVTNHAFPIGKGVGQQGFTSLLCASGSIPIGQSGADPICQSISGDITISAAGVAAIGTGKVTNAMLAGTITVALGGTACAVASGTCLDNITGFSATGFLVRTGAGTYSNRTIGGTANQITIVNGDGVAGPPVLSIPSNAALPGAPTTTTAAANDNSTKIATTAFYAGQAGTANPVINGTAAPGVSLLFARQDHVHPSDTTRVPTTTTISTTAPLAGGGDLSANRTFSINANGVGNGLLATMAANTIKANATGGVAAPTDVVPATARSASLLNVDSFTGHGDSIYTILATDRTVGTNAAFTASRTWTLPAANAVNPGQEIIVADYQGTVTGVNTLVISRAGADTVNGGTSVTITAANGAYLLKSDGVSKWTAQALGSAAAGGVSSVTCFGVAITTSGTCTTAATKSDEQAGSSTTAVVTPSQQQQHASAAKAWVYFDGKTGGVATIKSSFGVTSVVRNSAGNYTITWSTAFTSATAYAVQVLASDPSVTIGLPFLTGTPLAAGSMTFQTRDAGTPTTSQDMAIVMVVAYGGQ